MAKKTFHIAFIAPSKYDEDGYVLHWQRSFMVSHSLAVLHGIADDCRQRMVLGEDVDITMDVHNEYRKVIPIKEITERIQAADWGFVGLTGVLTNQFPRALDIAQLFRDQDIPVVIGGYHVSGVLGVLGKYSPELEEAANLGVTLFAGAAEESFDQLLLDFKNNTVKPLYNHLAKVIDLRAAPMPIISIEEVKNSFSKMATIETSRGCPFKCSFCCIPNIQGRNIQSRDPDAVVEFIRRHNKLGVREFFFADDNFVRNREWEIIFDKLIALRKEENLKFTILIEVDTLAYKTRNFVSKSAQVGAKDVFIGMESIDPEAIEACGKKQNKSADYQAMFKSWYDAGCVAVVGVILGFPADTREKLLRDFDTLINDYGVEFVSGAILTPLPGSQDHKKLLDDGKWLHPDLNNYDMSHLVFPHKTLSEKEILSMGFEGLAKFYSLKRCWTMYKRIYQRPRLPGAGTGWLMSLVLGNRVFKKGPYEVGHGRIRLRNERRSNLKTEPAILFYPKYFLKDMLKLSHAACYVIILSVMRRLAKRSVERKKRAAVENIIL